MVGDRLYFRLKLFKIRNKHGFSALDLACKYGSVEVAMLLIAKLDAALLTSATDSLFYTCNCKVRSGELDQIVKAILDKAEEFSKLKEILEERDENNLNILHVCILNDHIKLVKMLLSDYSADLGAVGGAHENNLLHIAAIAGSKELFIYFGAFFDYSEGNTNNENFLHLAVQANQSQFIKDVFKSSQNEELVQTLDISGIFSLKNQQGFTPLMLAAKLGDLECLNSLLGDQSSRASRFDLFTKDNNDRTIFHICARNNNFECFQKLSALLNEETKRILLAKDTSQNTVLHYASQNGNVGLVKHIVGILDGAEVGDKNFLFEKNDHELTCFQTACINEKMDVVAHFLEDSDLTDLLLNDTDYCMNTPLHSVCLNSQQTDTQVEIVKLLLKNGANAQSQNIYYEKPFDICCRNGNLDIAELLYEPSCIIQTNKSAKSALYNACKSGNIKLVDFLITKGKTYSALAKFGGFYLETLLKRRQLDLFRGQLYRGLGRRH